MFSLRRLPYKPIRCNRDGTEILGFLVRGGMPGHTEEILWNSVSMVAHSRVRRSVDIFVFDTKDAQVIIE